MIETDSTAPAYLVLSDTFDPGWSATVGGQPVPIRPAYLAFRAVYLPQGKHTVVFTYRPAGFVLGLWLSGCGILLGCFSGFGRFGGLARAGPRGIELAATMAHLVVRGFGGDRSALGDRDRGRTSSASRSLD